MYLIPSYKKNLKLCPWFVAYKIYFKICDYLKISLKINYDTHTQNLISNLVKLNSYYFIPFGVKSIGKAQLQSKFDPVQEDLEIQTKDVQTKDIKYNNFSL